MTLVFLIAGLFIGLGAIMTYGSAHPTAAVIGSIIFLCGIVMACTGWIVVELRKLHR